MANIRKALKKDLEPLYKRDQVFIEKMKEVPCKDYEIEYAENNSKPIRVHEFKPDKSSL